MCIIDIMIAVFGRTETSKKKIPYFSPISRLGLLERGIARHLYPLYIRQVNLSNGKFESKRYTHSTSKFIGISSVLNWFKHSFAFVLEPTRRSIIGLKATKSENCVNGRGNSLGLRRIKPSTILYSSSCSSKLCIIFGLLFTKHVFFMIDRTLAIKQEQQ